MRVSTQLVVGYLFAVAAVLTVGALSWIQLREVAHDIDEIGEEWHELDIVTGAIATFDRVVHHGEGRERFGQYARALEGEVGSVEADGHDRMEADIFRRLAAVLNRASTAPVGRLGDLKQEAIVVAEEFFEEDRGRVPERLNEVNERGRRLRSIGLGVSAVLLLVPIIFFVHLRRSIAVPLTEIQDRIESLGGAASRSKRAGMAELASAVEEMARVYNERQLVLQAQVEARTDQLRHADRLGGLGKIAAAVAHEINNPLASISLGLEGLRKELTAGPYDVASLNTHLAVLRKQVDRCTGITSKMLTYARYRPADTERIAVGLLLRQAVDLVAVHARYAHVAVDFGDAPADVYLHGDAGQLQQVIVNLLLNAIDASPREATIQVSARADDDTARIRVQDVGPGVAPAERERIFEPFVTTKRPGEGTGLGLAISREIVEAHGGRLELRESTSGALFEIALPIATEVRA